MQGDPFFIELNVLYFWLCIKDPFVNPYPLVNTYVTDLTYNSNTINAMYLL